MNRHLLSRREALGHLSAGALLGLGMWPGALRAENRHNSGSFRFLVINDTHYMSAECGHWLEGVVRQIKSHGAIDFCLHAGDLTENGRLNDLAAVRDILKSLGVPTFVQIGNHDYLNEKLAGTELLSAKPLRSPKDARPWVPPAPPRPQFDRRSYEDLFPGRLNYYFKNHGWQILGLDSSMGTLAEKTTIHPDTLRWVDDHLRKFDKKRPMMIFTHFPMGANVRYRPLNADSLLERFRPYNLQAVFCGHWHGFTEHQWRDATLTTNKCCALKRSNHDGTKDKGYFLCTAADGKISRRFVEFTGRRES